VARAFHARLENVTGPDWIKRSGAQLYSFEATFPPETTQHDFDLMFQRFLTEQFALKLRYEAKPFHAYALMELVEGAVPTKLKPSADPEVPELPRVYGDAGPDGFPVMPPGHGHGISFVSGAFYAKYQNYTMSEFAEFLTGFIAQNDESIHYVVDKTRLTGPYDFTLKFAPPGGVVTVGPAVAAAIGESREPAEPAGVPNIIKAVERQLGLKLVKTKDILMDTIVIDEAQKIPRGN
jgi:uncharacterized protein (TIGR03435 family)